MRLLDKVRLRLRSLFRRGNVEQELGDELRFHLDQLIEENIASGMTPDKALMAARRAIGGIAQFEEECRDMRRVNVIEDSSRDLRHAVNVLLRAPGFTALAVVTLALGIGATTAIFSVVYGVLLKPLPFPEPERLAGLYHAPQVNQGPATFLTYLENQRAFEDIGAWDAQQVSITGRGEPERIEALAVTAGTLPLLRVQPLLGRLFNEEDDRPGSPLHAVVSNGYWQRRFGGASDILGHRLNIDGVPAEVIGVLPASFKFLRTDPALLFPMQLDRAAVTGLSFGFQALGRLKPGVTLSAANADMARMLALVIEQYGGESFLKGPNVRPLDQDVIGNVGRILWILLAAVGIVLLIACGNVANLFLIRAEVRQQELAMRAALGASRSRIARMLLSESVLLALGGGALGLVLAQATIGLLRAIGPARLPRLDEISIDLTVLLFTLGVTLLSAALFGGIAVLRFGSPSISALKEGSRSASDSRGRHRTRNALVVTQVALALMLLIVSGLMIRTFVAMRQVQPGFTGPEQVQTFRIDIPEGLVQDDRLAAHTYENIMERLRQVPGVEAVGLSSSITMDGEDNSNTLDIEEFPQPEGTRSPMRRFKALAPGYFETMGNHLVAGREITWTDIYAQRPVLMISENLAREYWKEPSMALGKRARPGPWRPWSEIVGVSAHERDDGLNQPVTTMVYWPLMSDRYEWRSMAYSVRSTRVGAEGFMRELQQAVWSVNGNLPLSNALTLEEIQADSMAQTSFAMVMLAIAASVALLLGVVGIYGVIAYIATQRTKEIGIRMALGAKTADVRRLFLRHGLALTLTGIVLGMIASVAATRVLSALLFGVGTMDPPTYLGVSACLAFVALLATWLPARRASRIDPIAALRTDT